MTQEQILAVAQVRIEALAATPDEKHAISRLVPNYQDLPAHQFAVALLSGMTGVDSDQLSRQAPDLGLAGSINKTFRLRWFTQPEMGEAQLMTALHDATDFLTQAGVKDLNRVVWGHNGTLLSALAAVKKGVELFFERRRGRCLQPIPLIFEWQLGLL